MTDAALTNQSRIQGPLNKESHQRTCKLRPETCFSLPSANEKEVLRLRAEQFLERKTQAIAFKRSVARELDKLGIRYTQDYCEGIYSTDFLIEKNGKRIALECKANLERDFEKAIAISELLRQNIKCQTLIVTPYIHEGLEIKSIGQAKLISLNEISNKPESEF